MSNTQPVDNARINIIADPLYLRVQSPERKVHQVATMVEEDIVDPAALVAGPAHVLVTKPETV